ncbi:hypothetical protein OKA05_02030 [Luteolibacter arcticus]|uniref:Uncharacterized protein n=1 Tax=Luteolibacter arcticus TaxID=1581411 RepID=A0ABT3GCG1_9BACT|nr:hypothetical protein [Luteolibacter arcticus]MCW1921311.1 hypothetical protein [Luteolibacter arcticus]
MKQIKITKACLVKGEHKDPGAVVNVDIVTAQQLLDADVGTLVPAGKVVNHNADKVESRDPAPENRDPATAPATPAKKRGKAKPEAPAAPAAEPVPPAAEPTPATADPAPPAADTPAE